jgi:hypothetical protein
MGPSNYSQEESGWNEYQVFVIEALKRLETGVDALKDSQARVNTEIALLKLKSSFWGAVAGLGAYGLTYAIEILKRKP